MALTRMITPCLWFTDQAQSAADFYTAIFDDSRITDISYYGDENPGGQPAGSVMTVAFELNGQPFTALNGGPHFQINEAISFQVLCDTQKEIDFYWDSLSAGGDEGAQQCGWLKDRFGVSWQIVPSMMGELLGGDNPAKAQRAVAAMLKMKKLDIAALKAAREGED